MIGDLGIHVDEPANLDDFRPNFFDFAIDIGGRLFIDGKCGESAAKDRK
jgi:hypothetical protein